MRTIPWRRMATTTTTTTNTMATTSALLLLVLLLLLPPPLPHLFPMIVGRLLCGNLRQKSRRASLPSAPGPNLWSAHTWRKSPQPSRQNW